MRLIIIVILAILWFLFGILFVEPCFDAYCTNGATTSKAAADKKKDTSTDIAPATKVTGPLLFNWNKEGAVTGMIVGIALRTWYMLKFKFGIFEP